MAVGYHHRDQRTWFLVLFRHVLWALGQTLTNGSPYAPMDFLAILVIQNIYYIGKWLLFKKRFIYLSFNYINMCVGMFT